MTTQEDLLKYKKQYSNITLKSLTAYQLMSHRESMLEVFGAIDDSERYSKVVNEKRQKATAAEIDELLKDLS
ncbi:uncharacterized protein GVI51_L07821 [Nakaseomyces glabratus]|uniref:Component of the RSC chromatin remodeling complex n=1 Tax=Candida glabrata TaxID=5478 RepID=A0A7G7JL53_CANGB|nr:hypothetical protein J7296_04214 [Nakaseomyces glabratus]KAH7581613.1 hypothetical protein J7298_04438 [Nakaseomyces glabratus]KAH7582875.1 hypothetical protein J7297_04495 [Nakaseomyces glabratus]KAH7595175.1 hypothetical protein J7295_04398 [Nakaseomyces glabratus]KAH7595604.1 hypothetical protein J7294_04430 [Nakaseomyces glabratus]